MAKVNGFMVFTNDQPMVSTMNPHPNYAPQDAPETFDAKGWADCFNVLETIELAQADIKDDIESTRESVEEGELEGYEDYEPFACAVSIDDDGNITIFEESGAVLANHTAKDMYEAFGMEMPAPTEAAPEIG